MNFILTFLFSILGVFVWVFSMIAVVLCTLYIIKIGLKEIFNIDVSGVYAIAEVYLKKVFSNIKES